MDVTSTAESKRAVTPVRPGAPRSVRIGSLVTDAREAQIAQLRRAHDHDPAWARRVRAARDPQTA